MSDDKSRGPHVRRYLLSGLLTVIPLWITWLVLSFVFAQLSTLGGPWVRALARTVRDDSPLLARLILHPWFQDLLAVLLILLGLYWLGWAVNRMVGRRVLHGLEALVARVPVVATVYSAVRKLTDVLQYDPEGVQRVVLIEYPTPGMHAIGFVTRTMTDSETGRPLAAIFVPTTPNPTSGYLEIVPVDNVVSTDWTVDQAMYFLLSGGASAPDRIRTRRRPDEHGPAPGGASTTPSLE